MQKEYMNFVKKRISYLIEGDTDAPAQANYTVMVERIPTTLKSNSQLKSFFNNLFPGTPTLVDLKSISLIHHFKYLCYPALTSLDIFGLHVLSNRQCIFH